MQWKAEPAFASSAKTDALVVFHGKGDGEIEAPDQALQEAAREAAAAGEFAGKAGERLFLRGGRGGRRLLVVGLGDDRGAESLRRAAAEAARALDAKGIGHATFLLPPDDAEAAAAAVTEGAGLGMYRFGRFRKDAQKPKLRKAVVAPARGRRSKLAAPVREARALVAAASFARDLGNLPGNVCTPVHLAREARKLASDKLKVRAYNRADIKRMKMGAFSAVAAGSTNEPRLIEFTYRGAGAKAKPVALVGKGVTFDTGGISIKPWAGMDEMKFDMGGGAAVFGLMHAVAALKPKVNVHALVPATDNMPDGSAYRPGDILTARNGKTIEVISTDAEGRLLLCDALAYAAEKKPACLIDLATLTGACVVALGDAAAGLFGTDDGLLEALRRAGDATGEIAWPMPLFDRYTEMMKGTYADLKNGGGRWAGACTAAAFLKEFTDGLPWAHIDIAGVAWADSAKGYGSKGATGYGVRLLWEFLKSR